MSSMLPKTSPGRERSRFPGYLVLLLVLSIFVALAFIVTFAGIHLLGGISQWQQWLDDHAGHFFIWRLCLYAAIAAFWPWVRRRRLQREPDARSSLRMIEALGLLGLALSEASNWLRLS